MGKGELILGVDPGSLTTGYGLITSTQDDIQVVGAGVIRTNPRDPFPLRLKTLYDELYNIIAEYSPTAFAIEDVFIAKNVRSALKLGHARAALIMAAVNSGLEIHEYSALQVKRAVVGYGKAEKSQVQSMVSVILEIDAPIPKDASDALAVALCHLQIAGFNELLSVQL